MSDSDEFEVEGPNLAHDDPMRAFLPAAFGKQSKEVNIAAQISQSKRKVDEVPTRQIADTSRESRPTKDDNSDDEDDSDSSSDDDDEFPTSHELVIRTHERAVTTIALDPSGGRLVTGSLDCSLKLHDFSAMTMTTVRAFKSVDPWEAKKASISSDPHPIHHVSFSPHAGSVFLCVTAHPQAKIMSRDGEILTEFIKGDMYIRDMHHTKGHVGEVTSGAWHPTDPNLCVTAGSDSTLRVWDVNNKRSQKDLAVFKSKAVGSAGRTRMTAVAWGAPAQGGSNVLVAAALDGSLVMYGGNGPWSRPSAEIRDAHQSGTWTGGLDISSDGRMVVTRGGDGLIKLWDTRKFKEALVKVDHDSTSDRYPMTNIKYSPNSTSIITGSATGHLHILNPGNLRAEHVTPVTPGSPLITVDWHPKLNQIITGSENAETHVLYNPSMSHRGAVDVMSRAAKKRHIDDDPFLTMDQTISADSIVTPGGNPLAGRRGGGVSRNSMLPQAQKITPFMKSQPDEKHVSENIPLSHMLHEDPREALLKYAEVAKNDPMFTKAWKDTQPVTQYAELSDEERGPDKKRAKR